MTSLTHSLLYELIEEKIAMTGLRIAEDLIMVDVACNDPDNGLFAHQAQQISIGYDLLSLEARNWCRPPRFVETEDGFRLAGKAWRAHGSKYGVGNWCWNGYWMKTRDAADFMSWLHNRRLFTVECAEQRLFNMWQSSKPFDDGDREFIWRIIGKPSMHDHAA